MSLQTRYLPTPLHAGPSDHSAPVQSRSSGVLPCRRLLNAGSMVMTSGSTYVAGEAPGPKSRGGVVTVLSGVAGPAGGAWATAMRGATTATPAAITPAPPRNLRRETG